MSSWYIKDYHVKDSSIILYKQYVIDLLNNKSVLSCMYGKRTETHVQEN